MNKSAWYSRAIMFITIFVIAVAAWTYTNSTADRLRKEEKINDQRWCKMLGTLDRAYKKTPPTTDTGKELADQIEELYSDLGCFSIPLPR